MEPKVQRFLSASRNLAVSGRGGYVRLGTVDDRVEKQGGATFEVGLKSSKRTRAWCKVVVVMVVVV